MIEELTRKLFSKLTSNGTIISTAGVYLLQAPQNQAYPYITFFPVTAPAIHTHTSIIDDTTYQFNTFTTSLITLGTLTQEIKNTLDNTSLGLGTLQQVGLLRSGSFAMEIENIDEVGSVYNQPIEYEILVE